MGLMYQFPTDIDDNEHIIKREDSIKLRSYGLPPVFWGYLAGVLIIYSLMLTGIYDPLQKLLSMDDQLNKMLAYPFILILIAFPLLSISFFFYEKNLTRTQNRLSVTHKLFFIPIRTINYEINDDVKAQILHYLESPNMARIQNKNEMKGFQNKGYFQLYIGQNDQLTLLDRSSRKADLVKIADILNLQV